MYIQITNIKLDKFNQIQSTKNNIMKDIKKIGWNKEDCAFAEIRSELVDTRYRGADGKTVPAGTRQYKSRAKSAGTLNLKGANKMSEIVKVRE